LDPELYTKYLSKEGEKDIMYVKLAKALYGTLQAAGTTHLEGPK
jgi:hypothetical protein